jgi:hypothetical protein
MARVLGNLRVVAMLGQVRCTKDRQMAAALVALSALALCPIPLVRTPPSSLLIGRPRAGLVACSAARFADLETAADRAAVVAKLDALKASGDAPLWNSFRLAPRAVGLRELCQTTKLPEKVLDPTAVEYDIQDIQSAFVKVLVGATLASGLWAVGSDALGMDAGLRFTGTYLIAGVPIGILAIGSVAPGILFLPSEAFKSGTAKEETRERRARHEAAHLLTAHCLGVPVSSVSVSNGSPQVVVFDEVAAQLPGALLPAASLPALAVVAVSGLMAEAELFGKALGASADLRLLNQMMVRTTPPLPAKAQQDTARYAALMAWTIIKRHGPAWDAITQALLNGKGLAECLAAAEGAEAGSKTAAA